VLNVHESNQMKLSQRQISLLSLLAGVLLAGCRQDAANPAAATPDKNQAIPVELATVTRGPIEATLKSATHLEAEEDVKVYSRTANRVLELLAEEGDPVAKNQILARLDHDIQQTALSKAEVRLEKAQREFDRQKALFEQKLISEQVFTDAQLEVKQLQLACDDARRDLDYTTIRAPITGTITRRLINLGDLVNLNQHLFDLLDLQSTVARVYLPEKNLASIHLGQIARVTTDSLPDQRFTATVKRIAPVIESKSGTVKITLGFADVGPLRPGMFVDVEIVIAQIPDALLLTKRAIVYDGEQMYVFKAVAGNKVERVPVTPRIADNLNIEPGSGFAPGDQIVVAGQSGLKHGAAYRLTNEKPAPAEEASKKTTPRKSSKGPPS